uniref:Uncharacterized protein n=1 Tax=Xiphophorus maculatus TaxID=8083 RepID=A0A3B5R0I4_XIPMA
MQVTLAQPKISSRRINEDLTLSVITSRKLPQSPIAKKKMQALKQLQIAKEHNDWPKKKWSNILTLQNYSYQINFVSVSL